VVLPREQHTIKVFLCLLNVTGFTFMFEFVQPFLKERVILVKTDLLHPLVPLEKTDKPVFVDERVTHQWAFKKCTGHSFENFILLYAFCFFMAGPISPFFDYFFL